jgi:hypothetical protein
MFQAGRVDNDEYVVAPEEKKVLLDWVSEVYPHSTLPTWATEKRLPTRDEVRSQFMYLTLTSSPGLPFAEVAATKRDVIGMYSEELIDCVLWRMSQLSDPEACKGDPSPEKLVELGLVDPVRLFIKNEPHPVAKLKQERYRLISSCSIIDEIIFGLVFRRQNFAEIETWMNIPSKPGMGLSLDEQQKAVFDHVKPWIDQAVSSDVSGWDWSMRRWVFDLLVETHIILTESGDNGFYSAIVKNLAYCLYTSLFVTSDGRVFKVGFQGIMKSGSLITACWNSRARAMVARLAAGLEAIGFDCITMGDDCCEKIPAMDLDWRKSAYRLMGFRVEFSTTEPGTFEFCSHIFTDQCAIPCNPMKSFYNLLCSPGDESYVTQFRMELCRYPDVERLIHIFHMSRAD